MVAFMSSVLRARWCTPREIGPILVFSEMKSRRLAPPARLRCLLAYRDQRNLVGEAVRQDEVAASGDIGIAHYVAAARNRPALEFLRLGIEAHHCIRGRLGFAVPDDVLDGGNAVGRGFRTARRLPFLYLAGGG